MDTDSRPGRAYAAGDLRVSDADRDQALAELSEHFQVGRLTADELDDRSSRALGARTGNDLAVLLADLPPARAAAAPVVPPDRSGTWPGWVIVAVAAIVVSGVIALSGPGHHAHGNMFPWWLIPVAFLVLRCRRRGRRPSGTSQNQIGGRDERP